MRVLIVNLQDPASVNIRDRLIEAGGWEETDEAFRDAMVRQRGGDMLVQVPGPTIHDEALSTDVRATGWPVEALWFLSKHRARSGKPSLTVHPIGNHGEARFGGEPAALSPAAPRDMAALLRRLRAYRDAHDLPHEVTYEATHHGPKTDLPSLFVEIGSDEDWYDDRASGEALAAAITDVLDGHGVGDGPVAVGVGGGHYVPRQNDKTLSGGMDFGHLLPAYAVDPDGGPDVLRRCIDATPGCDGVYIHKKGLKGPERQAVSAWCEQLGVALL